MCSVGSLSVHCEIKKNSRLPTKKLIEAFRSVWDSPSIIGESIMVLGHLVHE